MWLLGNLNNMSLTGTFAKKLDENNKHIPAMVFINAIYV